MDNVTVTIWVDPIDLIPLFSLINKINGIDITNIDHVHLVSNDFINWSKGVIGNYNQVNLPVDTYLKLLAYTKHHEKS